MNFGVRNFWRRALSEIVYISIQIFKTVFHMPRGGCRFSPTCSSYAKEAFLKLPLHRALYAVFRRILRCRPGGAHGYDPVIKHDKE